MRRGIAGKPHCPSTSARSSRAKVRVKFKGAQTTGTRGRSLRCGKHLPKRHGEPGTPPGRACSQSRRRDQQGPAQAWCDSLSRTGNPGQTRRGETRIGREKKPTTPGTGWSPSPYKGPGCTSEQEADPLSTETEVSTHPCHSENRPQGREGPGRNKHGRTSGHRPRPGGLQDPLRPAS